MYLFLVHVIFLLFTRYLCCNYANFTNVGFKKTFYYIILYSILNTLCLPSAPGTERDDGHAVLLQELRQLPAGLQQVRRFQDPHPGRPPQGPDLGQRGHVRLRGRGQGERPEAAGALWPHQWADPTAAGPAGAGRQQRPRAPADGKRTGVNVFGNVFCGCLGRFFLKILQIRQRTRRSMQMRAMQHEGCPRPCVGMMRVYDLWVCGWQVECEWESGFALLHCCVNSVCWLLLSHVNNRNSRWCQEFFGVFFFWRGRQQTPADGVSKRGEKKSGSNSHNMARLRTMADCRCVSISPRTVQNLNVAIKNWSWGGWCVLYSSVVFRASEISRKHHN